MNNDFRPIYFQVNDQVHLGALVINGALQILHRECGPSNVYQSSKVPRVDQFEAKAYSRRSHHLQFLLFKLISKTREKESVLKYKCLRKQILIGIVEN